MVARVPTPLYEWSQGVRATVASHESVLFSSGPCVRVGIYAPFVLLDSFNGPNSKRVALKSSLSRACV